MLPDSLGLVRDAPQCRCAADLFEGLRAGRACASATPSAIPTSSPRWARCTCRSPRRASRRPRRSRRWTPPTNCWPAPTPSSPNAPGSAPRCATPATQFPPSQANFVWLPLARAHRRLRRAGRRRAYSRAPLRHRRRARHHRRARTRTTPSWRSPPTGSETDEPHAVRQTATPTGSGCEARGGRRAGDAVPADRLRPHHGGTGRDDHRTAVARPDLW